MFFLKIIILLVVILGIYFRRARRLNTQTSWAIYTITLIIGLYSFLLSVLVAIGQGIYIAIVERFRLNKITINYLLASFVALILFIPWIAIVILNFQSTNTVTGWTAQKMAISNLVTIWIANYSRFINQIDCGDWSKNKLFSCVIKIIAIFTSMKYKALASCLPSPADFFSKPYLTYD